MRSLRYLLPLTAAVLLAGCAAGPWNSMNVPPGTPGGQVVAMAGTPTRVVPLPNGGQRMQYSMQPLGREAYMVDIDASGRVVASYQALNEANFNRIEPGTWTRADIEREFGPPAWVDGVASWNGPIMTYRWRDLARSDMFYWVYLDPQGVVRRSHPGMEFLNAPNDPRR